VKANDHTISTYNLNLLPNVSIVKKISKSLALLDAILMPDLEFRYFSYQQAWDQEHDLASMRNGSGDEYQIVFSSYGAFIKGYAHESLFGSYIADSGCPWPGVISQIPNEFKKVIHDPAFRISDTTFFIWRTKVNSSWLCGEIIWPQNINHQSIDGSEELLFALDCKPETYMTWAEDYYETSLDIKSIEDIYRHRPLTWEGINQINPKCSSDSLLKDIYNIGYPEFSALIS
jgi:hypothetical protein